MSSSPNNPQPRTSPSQIEPMDWQETSTSANKSNQKRPHSVEDGNIYQ